MKAKRDAEVSTFERSREVEEDARLAALHLTGLLDTPNEAEFDEIVALASEICRTPIGLFTLVDQNRQWFKSRLGLELTETPRSVAFCDHTIKRQELFVVEDATLDERFSSNPLVTGAPHIRFYAGMPLEAPGGAKVGSLCVIDTVPRVLTESQRNALCVLASQLKSRMEMRAQQRELKRALSEREHVAVELAASERRFRIFMNHAPFMMYMKDSQERLTFYNARMAEKYNVSSKEWLGKTYEDLWPMGEVEELRRHEQQVITGGRMMEKIQETIEPNGSSSFTRTYKFPWCNERGETMLGAFAMDVTEELAQRKALEEANEKLCRQATIDVLTGLPNRRVLDERVEFEYRFALRHKTRLSVVLLDLDNFKKVNDRLGHAAGDRVLQLTGRVLREQMRATDLAARYGGEEFVIMLPSADMDGAILFAERVREGLRQIQGPDGPVTASLGIASMDTTISSGKLLIQHADEAMYQAKRTGKDRVATYCDLPAQRAPESEDR